MKKTFFAAALLLCSAAATAKSLTITVRAIRSDKGNILAMARIAGANEPVYGMAAARTDSVVVLTLTGIDAPVAELSLFHDEDGDYRMKTGDRGPLEGYATKKCNLPEEQNALKMTLYYPGTDRLR